MKCSYGEYEQHLVDALLSVVTGACSGEPRGLCWRELISMCIQSSGNGQIYHSVDFPGTEDLSGVVGCEVGL